MLKYICLLSGEVNHSLDSRTAIGASILTHVQKPTYLKQKYLHFLLESHSRRRRWNCYDVRAKNYFSLFLFIPPFSFGGAALFNDIMQFNCSSFHFQVSFPKVLFLNDIVHSKRVAANCSGGRTQNILNRSPQKKKHVLLRHYDYITVASVHVFKEYQINIFLLNEQKRKTIKKSQHLHLLSLIVHLINSGKHNWNFCSNI